MVLWVSFGVFFFFFQLWFIQKQIYLEPHGIGSIAQDCPTWVTLDTLFNLFVPQFLSLENGLGGSAYSIAFLWELI